MPGYMTLEQIVALARKKSGLFDPYLVRDGFEEDAGTADVDFVTFVNSRLSLLNPTGYVKCWFYQPVTEGQRTYTLDQRIASIIAVTYTSGTTGPLSLDKTSIVSLNANQRNWQNYPNGIPTRYYNDIPRQLGLDYPPDATDTFDALDPEGSCSLAILAEAPTDTITQRSDIPIDLNYNCHEALSCGAAIDAITSVMGGEQCAISAEVLNFKLAVLMPEWDTYYRRVEDLAQHREQSESQLARPRTLRNRYYGGRGRGYWGR